VAQALLYNVKVKFETMVSDWGLPKVRAVMCVFFDTKRKGDSYEKD
jgi:hypothetical protein